MATFSVRRFNGPRDVARSESTYTTVLKQTLPAGSYVVFAKVVMGLVQPELSAARLRLRSDGELDGDSSTVFAVNTATHFLQRTLTLTSRAEVRLVARARAKWYGSFSNLIAIPVEDLSHVEIPLT